MLGLKNIQYSFDVEIDYLPIGGILGLILIVERPLMTRSQIDRSVTSLEPLKQRGDFMYQGLVST